MNTRYPADVLCKSSAKSTELTSVPPVDLATSRLFDAIEKHEKALMQLSARLSRVCLPPRNNGAPKVGNPDTDTQVPLADEILNSARRIESLTSHIDDLLAELGI